MTAKDCDLVWLELAIVYSGLAHRCFWQCSESMFTGNLPVHDAPPIYRNPESVFVPDMIFKPREILEVTTASESSWRRPNGFQTLLTNVLVSGFLDTSSLEAGTILPAFLAESSAVLPCFAFLVALASPKMTLLSISSLFEANGIFDFLVLAPRFPFLGILGIGMPLNIAWCPA